MPNRVKVEFMAGDVIEFAGLPYLVRENYGSSGTVQEYPQGDVIQNFKWNFEGEDCKFLFKNTEYLEQN